MPWDPWAEHPIQQTPDLNNTAQPSDSDDEQDGPDNPPPQFAQDARLVIPDASRRVLFLAWDRTRDIIGDNKPDTYDRRAQAAIGFILDELAGKSPEGQGKSVPLPPLSPLKTSAYNQEMNAPPPQAGPSNLRLDRPNGNLAAGRASPGRLTGSVCFGPLPMERHNTDTLDLSGDSSDVEVALASSSRPRPKVNGFERDQEPQEPSSDEPPIRPSKDPSPRAKTPPPAQLSIAPEVAALQTILSIIPDLDPEHAKKLLFDPMYKSSAELVLEAIFSADDYPRVVKADKGKKRARDEEPEQPRKDFLDKGRPNQGKVYESVALQHLYASFPNVTQSKIKELFKANSSLLAPTYVALDFAVSQSEAERGWKLSTTTRKKGKDREPPFVAQIEEEKKWVVQHVEQVRRKRREEAEEAKRLEDEIKAGAFFECGCCFGESALSTLVMCSAGCQFCKECAIANANTQVGMRKFILYCMSTDDCQASFPEYEMHSWLPTSTLAALQKIKTEKELDNPGLEGLEHCPRCPFAMFIDNDQERLFKCQREDCMFVSCRRCKREDHLPKTCEEADEDKKINSIHKVEEAMSAALIRKCPKCSEPYVKEDGCNKIRCPSCSTLSCYICRKIIDGYNHFKNAGSNATAADPNSTCELWDNSAQRNFREVEAARVEAAGQIVKDNPAVSTTDLQKLNLDAPPHAVAGGGGAVAPVPFVYGGVPGAAYRDARVAAMEAARLEERRRREEQDRQRAAVQRMRDLEMQRVREERERDRRQKRLVQDQERDARRRRALKR